MSEAAVAPSQVVEPEPKKRRIIKIASWIAGIVALLVILNLLGVDVWGWLESLWDSVNDISSTTSSSAACAGAPDDAHRSGGTGSSARLSGGVTYLPVLAAYAAGVALNNFLPANIGTFVTLVMYVAIVRGSTFPGVLAGYVVQKIFYFIIGTLITSTCSPRSPARSSSSSGTSATRSRTTRC